MNRMTGPMTMIVMNPVRMTAISGVKSMSSTVGMRLRSHFSTMARNHTATSTGRTVPWYPIWAISKPKIDQVGMPPSSAAWPCAQALTRSGWTMIMPITAPRYWLAPKTLAAEKPMSTGRKTNAALAKRLMIEGQVLHGRPLADEVLVLRQPRPQARLREQVEQPHHETRRDQRGDQRDEDVRQRLDEPLHRVHLRGCCLLDLLHGGFPDLRQRGELVMDLVDGAGPQDDLVLASRAEGAGDAVDPSRSPSCPPSPRPPGPAGAWWRSGRSSRCSPRRPLRRESAQPPPCSP